MIRRPPRSTLFPYTTPSDLLDNVGALLAEAMKMADLTRIEVHGPAAELEKLKKPLAHLNPVWFALEKDRKSTRLNSSHVEISYAVFCLKKKKTKRKKN